VLAVAFGVLSPGHRGVLCAGFGVLLPGQLGVLSVVFGAISPGHRGVPSVVRDVLSPGQVGVASPCGFASACGLVLMVLCGFAASARRAASAAGLLGSKRGGSVCFLT